MAKTRYNIIEITQKKTGITYIYEDYSYWNREKGYSTHKRKSIGKLDANGNRIYNRYYLEKLAAIEAGTYAEEPDGGCASSGIPEEQLPPGDSPSVSYTILVGQKMVLDKCCNGIQLRDSLLDAFPSDDVDAILALAYYVVCQGKAFSRSEDWLVERGYSDLGLTSQRISELLGRISDDRRNAFFKSWMQRQPKGDSLLFDITSVSTYGTSNLYAERGYNRDGEDLEQVNLALPTSGEIQSAASDKISHSRVCYTNFAAKVIIFFVNLSPIAQILLLYARFCLRLRPQPLNLTSSCRTSWQPEADSR